MAGILDKKTRIMDVIVTREGRRQIADGNLRATFASFTDSQAFYEFDAASGSTDPTERIYFEAFSTPIDQIIFEKDDSGRLVGDIPVSNATTFGDQIFKHNGVDQFLIVTGSEFASEALGFITASIDNFKNQQIIGSEKGDEVNPKTFDVSKQKLYFEIDNYSPFGGNPNDFSIDIQAAKPLFFDERLAHLPQFAYLPPITRKGYPVGNFTNIQTSNAQTLANVISKIGGVNNLPITSVNDDNQADLYENFDVGEAFLNVYEAQQSNVTFDGLYQRETVDINNTSYTNNLLCQVFEVNSLGTDKRLIKLDVIDQGEFDFYLEDGYSSPQVAKSVIGHEKKRFFYVGKVFQDDFGVPSFINIFTIVFD